MSKQQSTYIYIIQGMQNSPDSPDMSGIIICKAVILKNS